MEYLFAIALLVAFAAFIYWRARNSGKVGGGAVDPQRDPTPAELQAYFDQLRSEEMQADAQPVAAKPAAKPATKAAAKKPTTKPKA